MVISGSGPAVQDGRDRNRLDPSPKRTPLPKLQVFIVYLIQFSEPVTATVIYPFVNQFVRETGVNGGDEKKTGYYAGVIESAFFFAEAITVFSWGWASDRIGRRSILLLGPLGLSFAMLSFGLSKSFVAMVASRCLQGIFNGNIGVSKSVLAEITDPTNIADAFALMPVMWSIGTTIGPILGGVLSRPSSRWPDTLGKIQLLREHPYFLPSAAAALIAFFSFIFAFLGLKETLPSAVSRQRRKKLVSASDATSRTTLISSENDANYGSTGADTTETDDSDMKPPPFRALLVRQVLIPITSHLFITFVSMSILVLIPLMYSTPIELGGLGFTEYEIGVTLGIWGIANTILQAAFLAKVIRRFGPRRVCIVGYRGFFVSIVLYPVLSFLARRAGRVNLAVWIVIAIQLACRSVFFMALGAITIFIVDSAPNRAALGATNGLSQTLACASRALAPTLASSLFSMSLQYRILGGNLVYVVLFAITLVGIPFTLALPKHLRSHRGST